MEGGGEVHNNSLLLFKHLNIPVVLLSNPIRRSEIRRVEMV